MTSGTKNGECGCSDHKAQDTSGAYKNKPVKQTPATDKKVAPEAGQQ